jgi:GTP-binding protein EngB required for normal cell division
MTLKKISNTHFIPSRTDWVKEARAYIENIKCPGLTVGAGEIHKLAKELPKKLAVLSYKQSVDVIWVVFIGGTGTGKSTLFNAVCGYPLSEMGVERPKTVGPIVYVHKDAPIEEDFPLEAVQLERYNFGDSGPGGVRGKPNHLLMICHDRTELSHLAIADTPDLDSLEPANREVAEDLYLLADTVVFVTSQEKYADEIPFQLLERIQEENKPYAFVFNKAEKSFTKDEVIHSFGTHEIRLQQDQVFSIPYAPGEPYPWITGHSGFRDFSDNLFRQFSKENIDTFRQVNLSTRAAQTSTQIERLLELLAAENQAGRKWQERLQEVYHEVSQELIRAQKDRFAEESRRYLQTEIRKLFTRYDLLAKPRRFLKNTLLMPFRLLGFTKKGNHERHRQGLLKVREKINLTPVNMAVLKLNRRVLEKLSPSDETSPLFTKLREPSVQLQEAEIKHRTLEAQDQLAGWLEGTFQELSRGIPKSKRWGIYSTSALWGVLILSFEVTVGGGFTVLDAALDTALAPFVTKGAMELFAYHEIKKIARELATRYQDGLLSVLRLQRDRYATCVQSLMTPNEVLETLRGFLG